MTQKKTLKMTCLKVLKIFGCLKDKTEWHSNPLPSSQVRSRNILRQGGGPAFQ